MSILKRRFDECIARPNDGERIYPLRDHLLGVKRYMEQWADKHPDLRQQPTLVRLMGLAGCCHDMAKAHWDWQHYIRNTDKMQSPVHHAPAGALLFSCLGYALLRQKGVWPDFYLYWYRLTRDIADHHGTLKALGDDGWQKTFSWDKMDLDGIMAFIHQEFAELRTVSINQQIMDKWVKSVSDLISRQELKRQNRPATKKPIEVMNDLQLWRYMTTGLIAGDRFDIVPTNTVVLDAAMASQMGIRMEHFCRSQSDHPLAQERMAAQQAILRQLLENPDQRFYTLSMPTGYGKTVTALKIAQWFIEQQLCKKIIYVAPYISILEQTSNVIEQATGLRALEHHSLAIWDDSELSPNPKAAAERPEQRTSGNQLVVESWAHEVVCTSFQQFSRAVFPKRAQDVLRRAFLQDSVILIDEPQIFRPEGWNTFLCGLESLANRCNLRVVFLSATMPPFHYGLVKSPVSLSYTPKQHARDRYQIHVQCEPMDENKLADAVVCRNELKQAVILNTIKDAYLVRQSILERNPSAEVFTVHGMMVPLHKRMVISRIEHHLKHRRDYPLIVVSTQVLEAGVDVSFEHLIRVLPILPSIVQAAGRVNRHAEMGAMGQMTVVPFLRHGQVDTRKAIYDRALSDLTDRLLLQKPIWTESEMNELIAEYYKLMFQQNSYTAGMNAIHQAYRGLWPELGQFEPFGADLYRLPLFIPWEYNEEEAKFLPETYVILRNQFGMKGPEQIYDCYWDKSYWKNRDANERRLFRVLFHYYTLNIPVKLALKLASKDDYILNRTPYYQDVYDSECGLTQHFDSTYDSII
jgi:CRISPR-associated helicase Cas3